MAMSALGKKLMRDMRRSGMQFFAIVMLCSLGTFMFAGLDGTARLAQGTVDYYFEENNLADFWVSVPSADRDTLGAHPRHRRGRGRMREGHGPSWNVPCPRADAQCDGV